MSSLSNPLPTTISILTDDIEDNPILDFESTLTPYLSPFMPEGILPVDMVFHFLILFNNILNWSIVIILTPLDSANSLEEDILFVSTPMTNIG